MKCYTVLLAVSMLLSVGCSDITEYDGTWETTLSVFSVEGLVPLRSMEVDPDSRSIIVSDGVLYVACTDGYLRSYETATLEMITENQIGQPSSFGYFDMVYCSVNSSVYIIGAVGKVLEVDIPECLLADEISSADTPSILAITQGDPGYLWIADAASNSVHQVHLTYNGNCGDKQYPEHYLITAMAASVFPDSLLVGTTLGYFKLSSPEPGVYSSVHVSDEYANCVQLCSLHDDSNFIAVIDHHSGGEIGELCVYDDSTYIEPPPKFYYTDGIEEDPVLLATSCDESHAVVLSRAGDDSVLSLFRTGEDHGLEAEVTLPGYPLDMSISEQGEVYVLTCR